MNLKAKSNNRMTLLPKLRDEYRAPIWLVMPDGTRKRITIEEYKQIRQQSPTNRR